MRDGAEGPCFGPRRAVLSEAMVMPRSRLALSHEWSLGSLPPAEASHGKGCLASMLYGFCMYLKLLPKNAAKELKNKVSMGYMGR